MGLNKKGVGKSLGTVAQGLERATHNRLVAGSIPASPTGEFWNLKIGICLEIVI